MESISTLAGYSLVNEVAGASYGMAMVNLKPWDERKADVNDMIAKLQQETRNIADASDRVLPAADRTGLRQLQRL